MRWTRISVAVRFEIARQVIVVEQDAVLERLMPALDLALGLRMIWRSTNMVHAATAPAPPHQAGEQIEDCNFLRDRTLSQA